MTKAFPILIGFSLRAAGQTVREEAWAEVLVWVAALAAVWALTCFFSAVVCNYSRIPQRWQEQAPQEELTGAQRLSWAGTPERLRAALRPQ